MKDLIVIAGTRPEVIKLAPIIKELRKTTIRGELVLSGQHPDLALDVLPSFNLEYDERLIGVGRQNSLELLESKLFESMGYYFRKHKAKNVLALGDTSTVFAASRLAFLTGKKFFHIEAGLRTKNRFNPFPEEQNRRSISQLASIHFAPSEQAKRNLLRENYNPETIHVVGSPFIEAFNEVREIGKTADFFLSNNSQGQWDFIVHGKIRKNSNGPPKYPVKTILFTSHRRENISEGIKAVCDLALEVSKREEPHFVIWPVHPNPKVDEIVREKLKNKPRIKLVRSLLYHEMAWLMDRVDAIVTDSAGVMEEASIIGVPTVVARTDTERPDLVDSSENLILSNPVFSDLSTALKKALRLNKMPITANKHLYGGEASSKRIINVLEKEL